MTEMEVREKLRDWITQQAKEKPENLLDDTPLLETGVLSSLDIVELILFVEMLNETEVDLDDLEPESVQDINSIYSTFFA